MMKKWQRWTMVSGLVVGLAVAGCGDDPEVIDDNQNQNQNQNQGQNQNQNQNQNTGQNTPNQINQGDDEFAEDVDVWVGSDQTGEEEPSTELEVGQTFGGRFDSEGMHSFSLSLTGGDVLTVETVDFEDGLEANLDEVGVQVSPEVDDGAFFQFGGPMPRLFSPAVHDEREFFVNETTDYTVEVHAPGGEEAGFIFRTDTEAAGVDGDLQWDGTTAGDLDDAGVDVYELTTDELETVEVEMFAQRPPTSSDVDGWLHVWDADNQELVTEDDAQDPDVLLDPMVIFDAEAGTEYWIVVDMVGNVADAGYELETDTLDTSPNNRQTLSQDDVDSFDGRIEEMTGEPFYDYFDVTVEPGDNKKVIVEADDELQPAMELDDADAEQDFFAGAAAEALSLDDEAGATLGVGDDADGPITFSIDVTDQRNLFADPEETDVYYGGEGFEYTIRLEDADPDVTTVQGGDTEQVSFDSHGDIELLDVETDEDHVVWLDGGIDMDLEDVDIEDLDFLPSWGLADAWTLAGIEPMQGYLWGSGDDYRTLLRDYFFRGDDTDYDTEIRINSYDAGSPDYQETDLKDGNESVGDAVTLDVPASIVGEYEEPDDGGGGGFQMGGDVEAEVHYFDIDADAGDDIVVHTEHAANTLTMLSILDDQQEGLAQSGMYMEQRQEGDSDDEVYYDGAVVYEVDEDGTYTLEVEQYCDEGFGFCLYGEADVKVFID